MRDRGSAVLIKHKKIALIKRVKNNVMYYVFPGGGIKKGETPIEATKREAYEELGIEVEVKECIAEVEFGGRQYFFLVNMTGGVFGSGQGEEFTSAGTGTYIPVWVEIDDLSSLDVRPKEVAEKLQLLCNESVR